MDNNKASFARRLYDGIKKVIVENKLFENWPGFVKNTSTQQGVLFWIASLFSLYLVASLTVWYVEHELDVQNEKIFVKTQEIAQKNLHADIPESQKNIFGFFSITEIDDDPIDDDEIIDLMTLGFMGAGLIQAILIAILAAYMAKFSNNRIKRIESVLESVSDGDLSARTGVTHTQNDLARISRAMDEMLSRLQGSVAAMSDISSNIAHELKTPITRLRHNLLTIREEAEKSDGRNTEHFYKQLDSALDESMRLASIFDALLRISQIESGARRSRFTWIDINEIIALVGDIYTDVADEAEMKLVISSTEKSIYMLGDKELLTQQIANLIENALRYCHAGCQIKLGSSIDQLNKQVVIVVEDTGPGVPESERERVFERLYRVDKSRTDGGLGLGLSLAKAVARLHYGMISLYDCRPGLGVQIAMPYVDNANALPS